MDAAMDDLDDPAAMSRSAAPALGRHVVVLGHFKVDMGYSVSRPRGARSWLLTWTIAGRGQLAHEAVAIDAGPGDLVVLGPDVAQRYSTVGERWEFWWAHYQPRPLWTATLEPWRVGNRLYRTAVADPAAAKRIGAAFARAFADLASPDAQLGDETIIVSPVGRTDLVLNALEEVLLVARSTGHTAGDGSDDRIATALRAIAGNPAAPHTVESLAALAAWSPPHFAHEFRRRTGRTPMEAVRDERLRLATSLLRSTSLTVGQVARAAGFADPFYFSRVFRRHVGVTPSSYATAR